MYVGMDMCICIYLFLSPVASISLENTDCYLVDFSLCWFISLHSLRALDPRLDLQELETNVCCCIDPCSERKILIRVGLSVPP